MTDARRQDSTDPPTLPGDGRRAEARWRPSTGDWIAGMYKLGEVLGEGGLGIVFRAHDTSLGRNVAIKLLSPEHAAYPALSQRLVDEARAMAAIEHPRLVTVYACGAHRGAHFVVMELVEGESALARLRESGGKLSTAEVLTITSGVAEGLDWLHASGREHGDVKPSNILLTEQGGVRLIDIGITVSVEPASFDGTPAYAAPERILRERPHGHGRATDIYSLAVTAFELFTGTLPFRDRGATGLAREAFDERPPSASARRNELPAALDSVLASGLARNPIDRPASAGAFIASIRAALSAPSATPTASGEASWPLAHRATRRILIIDRDSEASVSLSRGLARAIPRCTIETAEGSEAALLAVRAHAPDAILVDIEGGSSADVELVRGIRALPGGSDAVIIALSATGGASDLDRLRALGVVRLYLKPVVLVDVLTTLERAWQF